MARPTFVYVADSVLEIDDFGKTVTVFKNLRDGISASRIQTIGPIDFAEVSTLSLSFVELADVRNQLFIPSVADYTGIQRRFGCSIQAKTDGGATGTYRLRDNTSGNTGGEVTTVSGTYVRLDLTIDLDAAWVGTQRKIKLDVKSSSGSNAAYAVALDRFDGWLEY